MLSASAIAVLKMIAELLAEGLGGDAIKQALGMADDVNGSKIYAEIQNLNEEMKKVFIDNLKLHEISQAIDEMKGLSFELTSKIPSHKKDSSSTNEQIRAKILADGYTEEILRTEMINVLADSHLAATVLPNYILGIDLYFAYYQELAKLASDPYSDKKTISDQVEPSLLHVQEVSRKIVDDRVAKIVFHYDKTEEKRGGPGRGKRYNVSAWSDDGGKRHDLGSFGPTANPDARRSGFNEQHNNYKNGRRTQIEEQVKNEFKDTVEPWNQLVLKE